MKKRQQFDVVIVGAGIVGLAAAYHLRRIGIKNVVIIHEGAPLSEYTPGYASAGLWDHYTRICHARGDLVARTMWQFGTKAFLALKQFLQDEAIAFQLKGRRRWATSHMEAAELRTAHEELEKAKFAYKLRTDDLPPGVSSELLQPGENVSFDPRVLLAALKAQGQCSQLAGRVETIDQELEHLICRLADGSEVFCEMLICGTHLGTASLLPALTHSLIPVADQWVEFAVTSSRDFSSWIGDLCSFNFGHEWLMFISNRAVRMGGARFLRPMAGIEAPEAKLEEKITAYLHNKLRALFPDMTAAEVQQSFAGREIFPCDELPMIGPMFGMERIILATGFMGHGLTLGFYSGQILADFVAHGRSSLLPEFLLPQRLRSLPAS